MKWMTDAEAHYRLQAALQAGKAAVRKVDNLWYVFSPGVDATGHGSFRSAVWAALHLT